MDDYPPNAADGPIVVTTSSPSPDLVFLSPDDPSFDGIARTLLGAAASGPALKLKPFLVVLANRSHATVVAYQIVWKITYTDTHEKTIAQDFNYPDGVIAIPSRAGDLPFAPEEQRLIGREFQLDPSWADETVLGVLLQAIQDQEAEMPRVERLDINLDAALFVDGLLVGPDVHGLSKRFAVYVDEKEKWIRQVVSDWDAGRSIDEAFETMSELKGQPFRMYPGPRADVPAFYRRQTAAEIFGVRKRIGDAAVPSVFRKAIRTEPFAIHRQQT